MTRGYWALFNHHGQLVGRYSSRSVAVWRSRFVVDGQVVWIGSTSS